MMTAGLNYFIVKQQINRVTNISMVIKHLSLKAKTSYFYLIDKSDVEFHTKHRCLLTK
jgi:hypothetical protein